jgi:hypothetical protein
MNYGRGRAEEIGRSIYHDAGLRSLEPPRGGAFELAALLYDGDVIHEAPLVHAASDTARIAGRTRIVLRPALTIERANFETARMIARLKLREGGRWSAPLESLVAGYLVAPRDMFCDALLTVGFDTEALARPFAISHTCAALRVVECGEAEGVVVTPTQIHRPCGGLGGWMDDLTMRKLARSNPRSLRKVRIDDEPGRVALFRLAA